MKILVWLIKNEFKIIKSDEAKAHIKLLLDQNSLIKVIRSVIITVGLNTFVTIIKLDVKCIMKLWKSFSKIYIN